MNYARRVRQFQKEMKCDATLLYADETLNPNMFYFTGFKGFGILVIHKKKKPIFFTSKLDAVNLKNKKVKLVVVERSIRDLLQKEKLKGKKIGFDYSSFTVNEFNGFKKILKPKKTIDISPIILKQRVIKDADEIKAVSKACKESADILKLCVKNMKKFTTEKQVKVFLEVEAKKRGYELAFETIVASGKNGADPHYLAASDKLRKGFLVIDWGVKVDGYCADMCRTLYLGKPSKQEIDMYNKVLSVQKKAILLLKENKSIKETDEYVRKELGDAYVHALGHGVGIEIHEDPRISSYHTGKIKNGTTFAVEPGVYYPGKYGIRIEDSHSKVNGKIKVLTPMTKELIIINKKGL